MGTNTTGQWDLASARDARAMAGDHLASPRLDVSDRSTLPSARQLQGIDPTLQLKDDPVAPITAVFRVRPPAGGCGRPPRCRCSGLPGGGQSVALQLRRCPLDGLVVGSKEVQAPDHRERRCRRTALRAYSMVLMIPAWPQPVITTRPSGVSMIRDASSGMESSTTPSGVCRRPSGARGARGAARTGPVSQTPEDLHRSAVNEKPAAGSLVGARRRSSVRFLPSSGDGRLRKMPSPT